MLQMQINWLPSFVFIAASQFSCSVRFDPCILSCCFFRLSHTSPHAFTAEIDMALILENYADEEQRKPSRWRLVGQFRIDLFSVQHQCVFTKRLYDGSDEENARALSTESLESTAGWNVEHSFTCTACAAVAEKAEEIIQDIGEGFQKIGEYRHGRIFL
jgi:hypothetical protein